MRLSLRLTITLAVVAVVPLVSAGLLWLDMGRKALEEQVRVGQVTAAERVADGAAQWLGETIARVRLSLDLFDLHRMDAEARVGALRIIYWQVEEAPVVTLHDASGALVAAPVFRQDTEVDQSRLPSTEEEVDRFIGAVPFAAALISEDGLAVGEPYLDPRRHAVLVPLAVKVVGAPGDPLWVLGVELALRPLQDLVGRLPHDAVGTAYLVDERGRILVHPDGGRLLETVEREGIFGSDPEVGSLVHRVEVEGGETLLSASAALHGLPWVSVVEQTETRAFRAVRAMVRRTAVVLGIALTLALVIGVVLARGIAGPVASASAGARAIAGGDLSLRLAETGGGEIRDLARSFNAMAEELGRSRAEIEAFNRDLQQRVADRTSELKKAQSELLQSRKLAAIGELGAGVAHELNNPLTGILGMTQIILRKKDPADPDARLLRRVEEDAKRCREITMNLLRFSEQSDKVVLVESDLDEIAGAALDLHASLLRSKGLVVEQVLAGNLPKVRADQGQLQQALLNLLSNAGHATPEGGKVAIETGREEAFVFVRVRDTGRGIPKENLDRILEPFFTTKDDWRGAGLGLSVAYRIVQSHNGTLEIESEFGSGSTFTIRLPLSA